MKQIQIHYCIQIFSLSKLIYILSLRVSKVFIQTLIQSLVDLKSATKNQGNITGWEKEKKKTLSSPKREEASHQRLMNIKDTEFFEQQNGQVIDVPPPRTPESI